MAKDWKSIQEPTALEAERAKYRSARTSYRYDLDTNAQYVVVVAKVVDQAVGPDGDFAGVKAACEAIDGVLAVEAVADFRTPESVVEGGKFVSQVDTRLRVEPTVVEEDLPE